MSLHVKVICNICNETGIPHWNGEHHIAPDGWAEFVSPKYGSPIGLHCCEKCINELQNKYIKEFVPKNLSEIKYDFEPED